jgi:signal transduction histidine kinase
MTLAHVIVVVVALVALLIGLWSAARARQARRLAEDDLARLGGGLLKVQEAERARIARELHDGISQQLAVVALELDALQGRLPELGNPRRADVAVLAQGIRTIAADLQQVTRGLHPARLEHLGLVPAVRALARDMEHYKLRIDVVESDWPVDIPSVVALSLYRVAQEALHNAAKHSGADTVAVSFRGGSTALTLTITDPGIGFDTHGSGASGGLGIVSMRQRLRTIGGSLTVTAAPGQGTQVQARLPRHVSLFQLDDRGGHDDRAGHREDAISVAQSKKTG